jgi:hypothetical protein
MKAQEITPAGAQNPDGETMVNLVAVAPHFGYGYGGAEGKGGPVNTGDKIAVNEYRAKRVLDKGLAVLAEDYPPKEVPLDDPQQTLEETADAPEPDTPARAAKAKAKVKVSAKNKGRHK